MFVETNRVNTHAPGRTCISEKLLHLDTTNQTSNPAQHMPSKTRLLADCACIACVARYTLLFPTGRNTLDLRPRREHTFDVASHCDPKLAQVPRLAQLQWEKCQNMETSPLQTILSQQLTSTSQQISCGHPTASMTPMRDTFSWYRSQG